MMCGLCELSTDLLDTDGRRTIKAMTHQPTQLLSGVESGPVGVCVVGLQLDYLLHSSLVPDCSVGSRHPYDSTAELDWVMCQGLVLCYST